MPLGWFKKDFEAGRPDHFFYLRVDDRLIHGQVVIGCGIPWRLDGLILADDGVAAHPSDRDLYLQIIPESMNGQVLSVAEAIQETPAWRTRMKRCLIVVSSMASALRWREGECRPDLLILGGVHSLPQRRRILDYVHLSEPEIDMLRAIIQCGVRVVCQDVAANHPLDLEEALKHSLGKSGADRVSGE